VTTTHNQHHHPPIYGSHMKQVLHGPMVPTTIAGSLSIVGGLGLMVYVASGTHFPEISWGRFWVLVGQTAIIVGAALLTYAGMRRKGRSIEEAYRLGYDVGYENGYRTGLAPVAEAALKIQAAHDHAHTAVIDGDQ